MFDRVYTCPLLAPRAFLRSLAFSIIVTSIYIYESDGLRILRMWLTEWTVGDDPVVERIVWPELWIFVFVFGTNALTDYLSLFAIRRWLAFGGAKPVLRLLSGAALGVAFVTAAAAGRLALLELRRRTILWFNPIPKGLSPLDPGNFLTWGLYDAFDSLRGVIPGALVFAWLALLATSILFVRAIEPISRTLAAAEWALKDGHEHPLKVVGYVASIIVFVTATIVQILSGIHTS